MTTVKELIKQLETMPQDLEDGFYGVKTPTIVKLNRDGNERKYY